MIQLVKNEPTDPVSVESDEIGGGVWLTINELGEFIHLTVEESNNLIDSIKEKLNGTGRKD